MEQVLESMVQNAAVPSGKQRQWSGWCPSQHAYLSSHLLGLALNCIASTLNTNHVIWLVAG